MFSGGVVQVIDSLLIPPVNLTSTTNTFNLTAFEGALYASNTVADFSYTPNVTIFAPDNAAFQALGPAISGMTLDELSQVISYHLVPQLLYSTDLTNATSFPTEHGENITVLHDGNSIYIDSAQLVTADILIANGVLHVIDNVLNPQGPGAQPNPAQGTQAVAFANASAVASLPFTNALPCTVSCPVTSSAAASGSANATAATTSGGSESTSTHHTSSSKGGAPRETGFVGMVAMGVLGGAALMI